MIGMRPLLAVSFRPSTTARRRGRTPASPTLWDTRYGSAAGRGSWKKSPATAWQRAESPSRSRSVCTSAATSGGSRTAPRDSRPCRRRHASSELRPRRRRRCSRPPRSRRHRPPPAAPLSAVERSSPACPATRGEQCLEWTVMRRSPRHAAVPTATGPTGRRPPGHPTAQCHGEALSWTMSRTESGSPLASGCPYGVSRNRRPHSAALVCVRQLDDRRHGCRPRGTVGAEPHVEEVVDAGQVEQALPEELAGSRCSRRDPRTRAVLSGRRWLRLERWPWRSSSRRPGAYASRGRGYGVRYHARGGEVSCEFGDGLDTGSRRE
jgi:hypothetical protein